MTSSKRSALFRHEAIDVRRGDAFGHVVILQPLSLRLLSAIFVISTILFVVFLSYAKFSQRVTVSGMLVPDQGLINVHASRAGLILERKVTPGQQVVAGQLLYIISADTLYAAGDRGTQEGSISNTIDVLKAREKNLQAEKKIKTEELFVEVNKARKAGQGLEAAILKLEREIGVQTERLELAEQQYQINKEAQAQGFISLPALKQKRVDVLDQQGRLISLERSRISMGSELVNIQDGIKLLASKFSGLQEQLERQLLELKQEMITHQSSERILITAPQAGEVAAVFSEPGQTVDKQAMLSIVPKRSKLEAHLYVPSTAIAHIKVHDTVRIRFSAFQTEKFSTMDGVILNISNTTVPVSEDKSSSNLPAPANGDKYYIRVALPSQFFISSGNRYVLRPGMRLEADLLKSQRSLLDWIFKPMHDLKDSV